MSEREYIVRVPKADKVECDPLTLTVTAVYHEKYELEVKTRSYKVSDLQPADRECVWKWNGFGDFWDTDCDELKHQNIKRQPKHCEFCGGRIVTGGDE